MVEKRKKQKKKKKEEEEEDIARGDGSSSSREAEATTPSDEIKVARNRSKASRRQSYERMSDTGGVGIHVEESVSIARCRPATGRS